MHEYRPTLKELDGTNPGQNPYVLCRLFKKHDESLEGSNGEDVKRTASTPMTANHFPDEIQSDSSLDPASSSQITEGEKPLTVIHENSEEAISNIITAVDSHSDGCDAPAAQNQIVKPAAEIVLASFVSDGKQFKSTKQMGNVSVAEKISTISSQNNSFGNLF
ncbi:protein NTM1-like 9 isoform X1 [Vigna radiata var. radiata]|uniref:Protein NTM1-like 9 isoform X1 n=1 Tax=Vigna radiata var. radiata TaxID=3916 RepID=A0A1S3T9K6_VIGRR|nr:protein NTM1-like 9 isoform X1 [Vigna radiata var. radiata]